MRLIFIQRAIFPLTHVRTGQRAQAGRVDQIPPQLSGANQGTRILLEAGMQ